MNNRYRQWFQDNTERLLTLLGFILVGILSFEAGMIRGALWQPAPLVISLPEVSQGEGLEVPAAKAVLGESQTKGTPKETEAKKECAYVGSKNSNKYHLPTCPAAKRIKVENLICFVTREEAEGRGYQPSCIK